MKKITKKQFQYILNKLNHYAKYQLHCDVNNKSNSFQYDPQTHLITCDHKLLYTPQYICGYLHELGHALQCKHEFHKLKKNKKTLIAIMVYQEYEAWELGIHIAKQLDIFHDIEDIYHNEWVSNWYTYIKHLPECKVSELNTMAIGYARD